MTQDNQDGSMLGLAAAATLALAAAALGRPRGGSRSTALTSAPPVTLDTMKSKRFRFADYRRDPLAALDFIHELERRVLDAEGRAQGYAYEVPFRFPVDPLDQAPEWFREAYPHAVQPFVKYHLESELDQIQRRMQNPIDPMYQEWFTEGASILVRSDGRVILFDHNLKPDDESGKISRSLNRSGRFTISTPIGAKRIGPTDEQLRPAENHINRLILSLEQREQLIRYIQDWANNFYEKLLDEDLWAQYLIGGHWATRNQVDELRRAGGVG